MEVIDVIVLVFSGILILGTLVPLLPFTHWSVRGWGFPRLQMATLLLIVSIVSVVVFPFSQVWHYLLNITLIACFCYQIWKVIPYTPFYEKQVKKSEAPLANSTISLLASNVYAPNKNVAALLAHINQFQPDMVLTLETNHWWETQLKVLEADYPYTVKVPLENLYGMHLYSKLEMVNMGVKFLIDPEIPSIHGSVVLKSGEHVELHCLHPMPPSPTESPTSTDRDAELLLVGNEVDTDRGPVIVMGDLNDVAWSSTTSLFQKISGLLDPRRGRGFFNTFHAKYSFLRWPLDHIFHSNHFTLIDIERLPTIGSDHFPMYISLHLEPTERHRQEEPEADAADEEHASEKVAEGVV